MKLEVTHKYLLISFIYIYQVKLTLLKHKYIFLISLFQWYYIGPLGHFYLVPLPYRRINLRQETKDNIVILQLSVNYTYNILWAGILVIIPNTAHYSRIFIITSICRKKWKKRIFGCTIPNMLTCIDFQNFKTTWCICEDRPSNLLYWLPVK
jgi:hypothetical protein